MIYYYSFESTYKTEINFDTFFDSLNRNKIIYKNIKGINKYIEDWKRVFYDVYTIEKNKTNLIIFSCSFDYFLLRNSFKISTFLINVIVYIHIF